MPFTIERNDLSTIAADAIVVAANERLQITGGVGLTVAFAAGLEELQAACDEIGFCPCGSAVATPAFNLQAKTVVHAVGPVWQGGALGEADFLRSAYDAALACAVSEGARSIALPLISAGTYGFPADVSLAVARESIRAFLNHHDDVDVRLVLYSRESVTAGMAAYLDVAEYVDDHYVDEHPAWGTTMLNASGWYEERQLVEDNVWPAEDYAQPAGADAQSAEGYAQPSEIDAQSAEGYAQPVEDDAQSVEGYAQPDKSSSRKSQGAFRRLGSSLLERRRKFSEDAAREPSGSAPSMPMAEPMYMADSAAAQVMPDVGDTSKLTELLDSLDAPFSTTLLALIDERGLTDAQVYKRANISRQLFSKIRSDANYRPTKKTALGLALALGLDLDETTTLLARAGFALSSSSKADVIVEYFIKQGNYDIFEINEALYAFDQPLIGSAG